uniref:V-myb avian myeloblastosis viral oncogene homolog-like 2a n=1 Tax=Cyprinus carpio carpio TaxID=630221 RepID=A0A9J7ZBE3_CYPCA
MNLFLGYFFSFLPARSAQDCRYRFTVVLDPELIKGTWTKEEDKRLIQLVTLYGDKNWSTIAKHLKGRRGKQCQDLMIIKCHCVLGSHWPQIARFLPGRTNNSIKNHCHEKVFCVFSVTTVYPLYPCSASPSSSRSPSAVPPQHKAFVDDVLRMLAEDMLPLNFTEGSGFRKFMSSVGPQHPQLSQRTIALELYNTVEKTIKPQLIQQLRSCVSLSAGRNVVHITADIWAREHAEPLFAAQMHFLDDDWNIHRPTVAFRQLQCKQFTAKFGGELESVLLSYGIFPHKIGYGNIHEAKNTIEAKSTTHGVLCDYKIMYSAQKNDPDEDELLCFLDDQFAIDEYSIAEVWCSKHLDYITTLLHCVMKEALKKSRVVERILLEIQRVVFFFFFATVSTGLRFLHGNASTHCLFLAAQAATPGTLGTLSPCPSSLRLSLDSIKHLRPRPRVSAFSSQPCALVSALLSSLLFCKEILYWLHQYLSEPLSEGDVSVQAFWKEATRFPRLQSICSKLLAVPASSGGFKRLFSLASCIVRAQRLHTTERLLLY